MKQIVTSSDLYQERYASSRVITAVKHLDLNQFSDGLNLKLKLKLKLNVFVL